MRETYDYDVIIIGAGIGGLTCGCYLAKAGLKTLIVEQHSMPGGYCTSFQRKGYRFDSSAHYVGGVRKGVLSKILADLEASEELRLKQFDPSDKIVLSDSVTYIRANPHDTIKEFQKSFPQEKNNIIYFFNLLMEPNIVKVYKKTMGKTFKVVLDSFFSSDKLKASIGTLLLGNMGLPPARLSAFAAVIFCKEFLLDPGYYPVGGMQQFAGYFANKFQQYGGKLILSCKASKIVIKNNRASGILTESKESFSSKFVVSAIDATQTFKNLIDLKTKESLVVEQLQPSNSVFAVYLGVKCNVKTLLDEVTNLWFVLTEDIDRCYTNLSKNLRTKDIPLIMLSFPSAKSLSSSSQLDKHTMQIFTMATYENEEFWAKNRSLISDKMMSMAEQIIPDIKRHIDLIVTATPLTFFRYTLNKNGAAFGWDAVPEQMDTTLLPQVSSVSNLFLAGHWCIMGAGQGGVSTVALSGKKAAEYVMNSR